MARPTAHIQPLEREPLRKAGATLAASHLADPAYGYLFPNPERRLKALCVRSTSVWYVTRYLSVRSTVYGALDGGRVLGAAIWLPPGCFPLSAGRKLRATPAILSVGASAPRAFSAFARMGTNAEQTHPEAPTWYLEGLGVSPKVQGGGLGTRLLEPVLAQADLAGVPCYLETANHKNVGFYSRLGFHVDRELRLILGGPTHLSMLRPPARSDEDHEAGRFSDN